MTSNDQLIEELKSMLQPKGNSSENGLTFREIKRKLGISDTKLRDMIHDLYYDGIIEAIRTTRPDITGASSGTVVYRIKHD